ncbi:MAG: hypothetical protein LV480_10600 [Methylacidiphilales bacterium]|nr:hypothetical protein [Candidatus Methylacidiphilales bacterium]
MNYFLSLIIVGLCIGGYYEYSYLQDQSASDLQQISDLSDKIKTLQAENQKLEEQQAKSEKTALAKIDDLTKQLQEAQKKLGGGQEQDSTNPAAPKSTAPAAPLLSNNLGTITTQSGKTYPKCQLLKVKADGIVISYSDGITEIMFGLLPPNLQKRFGYDPHQAAALTEAQIEYEEEQRAAAGNQAGGN